MNSFSEQLTLVRLGRLESFQVQLVHRNPTPPLQASQIRQRDQRRGLVADVGVTEGSFLTDTESSETFDGGVNSDGNARGGVRGSDEDDECILWGGVAVARQARIMDAENLAGMRRRHRVVGRRGGRNE